MGLTEAAEPAAEPAVEPATEPAPEQAKVPPIPAAAVLGESPGQIVPDDSFGQAGRKAMWPHVERLLKFEPSLADPAKTDELKRYRVATRRLRAALRMFGAAYPDRQVRSLRDALGDREDGARAVDGHGAAERAARRRRPLGGAAAGRRRA